MCNFTNADAPKIQVLKYYFFRMALFIIFFEKHGTKHNFERFWNVRISVFRVSVFHTEKKIHDDCDGIFVYQKQ